MQAADYERLRSWVIDIAGTITGDKGRDEGAEVRFPHGLSIRKSDGAWYSFPASTGGFDAIRLVESLGSYSRDEALCWAEQWLGSHAGFGDCSCAGEDEYHPASREEAERILAESVDLSGTAAERYLLDHRRLEPPFPDDLRHLAHARCGESGLVAILRSSGRIVGALVTYVDPFGHKSTVQPVRRRFMLEKALDVVFETPYAGENNDVFVCEGIEDTVSVFRYGARRCRVLGAPGIGGLRHLRFPQGTKVTVVADGDQPSNPAAKALQTGLDALLLAGVDVHVTATPPPGEDANSILIDAGVDGLRTFLDSAAAASLSLEGEIERLARLSDADYELAREDAVAALKSRGFKVRISFLDEQVRKARERVAAQPSNGGEDWFDAEQTQPWPDPVDGTELLDDITKTIGSFVVMDEAQRHCVALWTLFTHCFDAAANAPKLWIKSAVRRSGKTRLIELLGKLTARPLRADSISAAMIPRVIESRRPCLLMDEVDTYIKDNEALRGMLNSGFDRDARIIIGVKVGDDWMPKEFSPWCPQAIAGIGSLPDTIADRSFKIELVRKPRSAKVARLRRRDIGPIVELAQKCARWAADHARDLVDAEPQMPSGLNDRAADAWELCIAIADLAGGRWPNRARKAALVISGDAALAEDESTGVLLLGDIRDIFTANKGLDRISSFELVEELNDLEEQPWPEFIRGKPLTPPQLARLLKPFRISPGTIRVTTTDPKTGAKSTSTSKGYKTRQFEKAFERYLPPLTDRSTPDPTKPPPDEDEHPSSDIPSFSPDFAVTPTQPQDFCGFEPDFEASQEGVCDAPKNAQNTSVSAACVGVTAKPEEKDGVSEAGTSEGVKPNGLDPSPTNIKEAARQLAPENPTWSIRRIARALGQPERRILRYLPDHNPTARSNRITASAGTDTEASAGNATVDSENLDLTRNGSGGHRGVQ